MVLNKHFEGNMREQWSEWISSDQGEKRTGGNLKNRIVRCYDLNKKKKNKQKEFFIYRKHLLKSLASVTFPLL